MKITFIKPNIGLVDNEPYLDPARMEPLTFAVLAGLTPAHHEVMFIDDRIEPIPYDDPTDLVALNTEIFTARRAYEIAERFRQRGVAVVLGGYHTSMTPSESLLHADAVVIGDAERVWRDLLHDAERKALRPVYRASSASPGQGPEIVTDWSIFSGKSYLPIRLTQFGRGCHHRCEYCAIGAVHRRHHFCRPVARVVDELARDGSKTVFFVDDNIVANKRAARELFTALIPLKIRWVSQADLSFANDPTLMELMVESGCRGLVVGFESLDRKNLAQMRKSSNLGFSSYDPLVERVRDAGLQIWAAFLLGYDNETVESVQATCDWALQKKFAFSAFNLLMPYPGTRFYQRMKAEGRLLYQGKWWLHDDYRFGRGAFLPRHISAEALAEACLQARLRHSSPFQILRRACDRKTHMKSFTSLLTYFAYNPMFRKEVARKHGMVLGYRGRERPQSAATAANKRRGDGPLSWLRRAHRTPASH